MFGPWFYLPGFHFGNPILTHSQIKKTGKRVLTHTHTYQHGISRFSFQILPFGRGAGGAFEGGSGMFAPGHLDPFLLQAE